MIEKITYIESNQFSPYRNLAVEEYLLLHCEDKEHSRNLIILLVNKISWTDIVPCILGYCKEF